ncbi:MAG TPA: Nramp family divalent metal transporter [Verrucomicrobiae bacterium]|nr:Nramp family divalent metal transporter [Verrucomicrobiae bacterium]
MSRKLRHSLGPSIIIAAAVVGTGELVIAPRLGATVGLSALWLIILGCVIKVFIQEEIGRHTILTGDTTLEALNRVPGRIGPMSWAVWCWLPLWFAGTLSMGGVLAGSVQSLQLLNPSLTGWLVAVVITLTTALVLLAGRYGIIESVSGLMVAGFTAMTAIALVLLQRTEFHVSFEQLVGGLGFAMPEHGFADAVAVFGVTGIGTSEIVFYAYWCLEKGYAKDLKSGAPRDPALVAAKIRGMRLDICVALVVYTFSTIAFFVLGATILHGANEIPKGLDMIRTVSQMYTRTFGDWVFYVFAVGAFIVCYSTFFVAMATWARMIADNLRLVSRDASKFNARRALTWIIPVLSIIYLTLFVSFRQTPQWLVVSGGAIQTLLLPVFAIAVLIIRRDRDPQFRPSRWYDIVLYLSVAIITIGALYSLWGLIPRK